MNDDVDILYRQSYNIIEKAIPRTKTPEYTIIHNSWGCAFYINISWASIQFSVSLESHPLTVGSLGGIPERVSNDNDDDVVYK